MADLYDVSGIPTDFKFTLPAGGNVLDAGGVNWSALVQPSKPITGGLSDLTTAIDQIGKGYVGAVQSYYGAKGAVADAKLQAKGNPLTQFLNTGYGAVSIPPTNLLLFGGLGLAAVLLLTSGGGSKRR